MTQRPVGIGFIGAGMISDTYLEHLAQFPEVEVVAIGDIDADRAAVQAKKHGVPDAGRPADVLAHPDVELIVNLTIPAVHAEISLAAIEAGKHVWSEKPIAVDRDSGRQVVQRAAEKGLRVGIAPDTILGRGVQSALRAIARGDIGQPLAASTVMQGPGPDQWHQNPEFFFQPGAGPIFDMGPYYLTTLVNVFGSVTRASAFGRRAQEQRAVMAGPRAGDTFPVEVPTHVHAILEFESGATSTSVYSWDSPLVRMGFFEITGTEGTLAIPDPNMFEGPLRVMRAPDRATREQHWEDLPTGGIVGGRGLGVIDMVQGIRAGEPHRASGEIGLHVLDTMIAIEQSVATGQTLDVTSRVERPEPVRAEWDPYRA